MDEKTPEEAYNPEKPAGQPFSKKWREAWKQLEERVRQRPGLHLIIALVIGYLLQIFPCRSVLVLAVKLCLKMARPILFLVCAFQLTKYVRKGSNVGVIFQQH
jgi:hypothetical protein